MNSIFLIVGCSGSGKTTIVEQLENKYGLKAIQSYTTRPKRCDSETGHIFVTDEEFNKLKDLVAYTEFCNNKYAATAEQVDTYDLYVIDPKGVQNLKSNYKGSKDIKIIYIKSDVSIRYERMRNRGLASGLNHLASVEEALQRVIHDSEQFYHYEKNEMPIDFCVLNNQNDNIEEIVDKVYNYIKNNS